MKTSNKKGFSLITTVLFLMMLSSIALISASNFSTTVHINNDAHQSVQALYIAEAGLRVAINEELDDDSNWADATDFTRSLGAGSVSVVFSNVTSNSVDITATGTVGSVSREITQSFSRTGGGIPEAFNYTIHGGNNINMNSSTGTITGDVSAANAANIGPTVTGTTTDNSGVSLPVVDFSGYENDAPVSQRVYSNYTFSGGSSYTGIWYIDGDVTIEDSVTISGSVVATGKIDMSRSSNVTIVSQVVGSNKYPALISGDQIKANRMTDTYVEGLVFAAGDVNNAVMNNLANVTFFGTIIAGNNVIMNASTNITITYDPAILTTPPPHFGTDATITESAWQETY